MYRYVSFDGLALPIHKPVDDLSSAQSESAVVGALNGSVDVLGNTAANAKPHLLEYIGIYTSSEYSIEDPVLLITEFDDFLITESGDFLVVSDNFNNFVDAWRARRGKRSVLVRQRDADGVLHWTYARLVQFEVKRSVENAMALPVRLLFELVDDRWREMVETLVTQAISAGAFLAKVQNATVTVASKIDIDDCVIEVQCDSGNIDYVTISKDGVSELIFDATVAPFVYTPLPAGSYFTFDCGAFRFEYETGFSLYTFFNLGATHSLQNWLELQPGDNTITFTITWAAINGTATARIRYYEQVP